MPGTGQLDRSRTGGTDLEGGRVVRIDDGKGRRGLLPFLCAGPEGAAQDPGRGERLGLPVDHRQAFAAWSLS